MRGVGLACVALCLVATPRVAAQDLDLADPWEEPADATALTFDVADPWAQIDVVDDAVDPWPVPRVRALSIVDPWEPEAEVDKTQAVPTAAFAESPPGEAPSSLRSDSARVPTAAFPLP